MPFTVLAYRVSSSIDFYYCLKEKKKKKKTESFEFFITSIKCLVIFYRPQMLHECVPGA